MRRHHEDEQPPRGYQELRTLSGRPGASSAELEEHDEGRNAAREELQIFLLGGFHVRVGQRWINPSDWYLRKPQSLVKLLVLAPDHRLHRGPLVELLWPGLDPAAGSQILTKALTLVQRGLEPNRSARLGSSYLHWDEDVVELGPPGRVWIDVEVFVHAAQRALLTWDPAAYDHAIRLYTGDLLPEDRFEQWTSEPREHLKALRLTLGSCQETAV